MQSEIQNPKSKILSLIVAMSENRVIGRDNQLPWHLPADLKRFKQITLDHTVIMGRKTFESMGKPLPRRRNVVITRDRTWRADGVEVVHSVDEAISRAKDHEEIFIIGGAEIFCETLDQADRLYLTLVHTHIEGDVCFPLVDWSRWKLVNDERHEPDEKNSLPMSFRVYERV